MQPENYVVKAGHRIGVVIAATDCSDMFEACDSTAAGPEPWPKATFATSIGLSSVSLPRNVEQEDARSEHERSDSDGAQRQWARGRRPYLGAGLRAHPNRFPEIIGVTPPEGEWPYANGVGVITTMRPATVDELPWAAI